MPGAELVLRIRELAPNTETQVIVNCAGRTRSIIGAQSLINAGLSNPVAALRNGTIGWKLAGQKLDQGQDRRCNDITEINKTKAAAGARIVADKAGVKRVLPTDIQNWKKQNNRTTYFFDVRTPEEFITGHIPGFLSAPGGQLVQETEMVAPVRGARLVLADSDNVRANMSASWLAQMGWETYVLDEAQPRNFSEPGQTVKSLPPLPDVPKITPVTLSNWLNSPERTIMLDIATSQNYFRQHIPGAWFVLRSNLANDLKLLPKASRYVVTSEDGLLAKFAAAEIQTQITAAIVVLDGGTQAWRDSGFAIEQGSTHLASEPIDRYKRPYEGTDNPREAMQGYLDWEFGLVEQLSRDGTHNFKVI